MKIGIFDPGESEPSDTTNLYLEANKTLDALIDLVPIADQLGFSRYWLGEHYEASACWRNTQVLIGILAGLTERIRIGSAGVKLNLYSPLLVAQDFKMLEYLYSNRIDMGIARGAASPDILNALGFTSSDFPLSGYENKIRELLQYFGQGAMSLIPPFHNDRPETWILATGASSTAIAIEMKLNLCVSVFHKGTDHAVAKNTIENFIQGYEAKWGEKPKYCVAMAGICGQTNEKAEKLRGQWKNDFFVPTCVGDASVFEKHFEQLAKDFQTDEIIFMSLCYGQEARHESFSLLAERFNLK